MDKFIRGLKSALQIVALSLAITLMLMAILTIDHIGQFVENYHRPSTDNPCLYEVKDRC